VPFLYPFGVDAPAQVAVTAKGAAPRLLAVEKDARTAGVVDGGVRSGAVVDDTPIAVPTDERTHVAGTRVT